MRKWGLILLALSLCACNKERVLDGKETKIRLVASEIDEREVALTSFSSFRVIVLQNGVVERYFYFPSGKLSGNELSVSLPIGSYKLLFIANGPEEGAVSCDIGDPLESVLLNLIRQDGEYGEAADFLTATKQVNITANQEAKVISVALRRKVGKIRVALNGLAKEIDSVKIELANVPKSLSADGKVAGSAVTVLKRVGYAKGSGTAWVELLTFPVAANKAEIGVLYSIGHITYRGFMRLAPAVDSNRVVSVTGSYLPTLAQGFSFDVQVWDEANVIDGGEVGLGDHNDVVEDSTPPGGVPVGGNLLLNAGFETWPDASLPLGWQLDNAGADKIVARNSAPAHVAEGGSSCLLGSRTYLYQDIPVVGRTSYQIRLKVKSNTSAYKWRVFCTWRKTASSPLPSAMNTAMQSAEAGATDGWVDVFGSGNKFRSPVGANILRVEVRAYSAGDNVVGAGEGVYIDDFDVRLLAE
jgi:hypothetical protein